MNFLQISIFLLLKGVKDSTKLFLSRIVTDFGQITFFRFKYFTASEFNLTWFLQARKPGKFSNQIIP